MENKILVLVMGANKEIAPGYTFYDQFKYSADTWLSKENRPANIDVIYYEGGRYLETSYKEENGIGILRLDCEDDLESTFKKTWMALSWIENNLDKYDWVFRTNTSTFVNLHLLKEIVDDYFVKGDQDRLYAADLYSLSEACAPYPLSLYPRGNGMLLSHLKVQEIIQEGISLLYLGMTDDIAIGNCINSRIIKDKILDKQLNIAPINDGPYHYYIKGLTHGWYRCVDQVFDNGHQLSCYGDNNEDLEYWSKFITIQMKMYRQRENEKANWEKFINDIYPYIKEKKYTYKDVEKVIDYSNNPSVFIGSIIGYIDYNEWKEKDMNELYLLEISHKASDDPQHEKYKEIQGKTL